MSAALAFCCCPSLLLPSTLPCAVVTNISQTGSSATVTTANGTQLTADCVIVTVPLGVLKQGSIGFEPPLPPEKQQAIQEMVRAASDSLTNRGSCELYLLQQ